MKQIDKKIVDLTGRKPGAYLRSAVRRRMTARAIARELGVTAPTVVRRLRELNFEPRPWSWRRIPRRRREAAA